MALRKAVVLHSIAALGGVKPASSKSCTSLRRCRFPGRGKIHSNDCKSWGVGAVRRLIRCPCLAISTSLSLKRCFSINPESVVVVPSKSSPKSNSPAEIRSDTASDAVMTRTWSPGCSFASSTTTAGKISVAIKGGDPMVTMPLAPPFSDLTSSIACDTPMLIERAWVAKHSAN